MKSNPDPDYKIELSKEAEDDIRDILQYTFDTFGEKQLQLYKSKLDEALQTLMNNPGLGHKRSDLPSRYDAYPVGEHLTFSEPRMALYTSSALYTAKWILNESLINPFI